MHLTPLSNDAKASHNNSMTCYTHKSINVEAHLHTIMLLIEKCLGVEVKLIFFKRAKGQRIVPNTSISIYKKVLSGGIKDYFIF